MLIEGLRYCINPIVESGKYTVEIAKVISGKTVITPLNASSAPVLCAPNALVPEYAQNPKYAHASGSMSAVSQKETFEAIVEETLGDECRFSSVKNIHEEMSRMIADNKEQLLPLTMEKHDIRNLLEASGSSNEKMDSFNDKYEKISPEDKPLMMSNVFNSRSFDVRTPDVVVKVKPDRTDLVNEKSVDGKDCLVIELNGEAVVNGINVRSDSEA